MIVLHQFAPAFGWPNASPDCMKLETWLRMAGLEHRLDNQGDVFKAPKGKLPYVTVDGQALADTQFIIDEPSRRHGLALDAQLRPRERAEATAFQRLFEENLYWAMVYTRWTDDANWPLTREAFISGMPQPLRAVVPHLARRGLRAQLKGHGMGRHRVEEVHAIACRDDSAVADFLGDRPFMLGERPCTLDATAYALLANLLWAPVDSPIRRHARARPPLEAYCQRMKARYFPG